MNSGDYPPGAIFDNNAPYNMSPIKEISFDVDVTQALYKNVTVETGDFILYEDASEDGKFLNADTSDTDWHKAYNEQHYTPSELIEELKNLVEELLYRKDPENILKNREDKFKHILKECSGWESVELEIKEV